MWYECCETPFNRIAFTVRLRRKPLYYIVDLVVPSDDSNVQIPPDCRRSGSPDRVGWVHSGSVQITLTDPCQTLSLFGSGRVVSKFNKNPTRPDPRTVWVSDNSAETILVVDLSARSRHVRTLSMCLVWSGRVGSGPCSRI